MSGAKIPKELDTPEFRAIWNEFLADRHARRIKATDLAQKRILEKMKPWGVTKAIQALSNSIERGWRGVFEPGVGVDSAYRVVTGESKVDPLFWAKIRALDDLDFCGYLDEKLSRQIQKAPGLAEVAELKAARFREHEAEIEALGERLSP